MKPPLLEMVVRTPELDRARYPHLHHLKYAFGGTIGTDVRDKIDRKTGKVTPHAKPHAGWDLYAKPGTETFAITDGTIVDTADIQGYGHVVLLEFQFQGRTLYALYAHLKREGRLAGGTKVREGDPVAHTGVSGNAGGEPPHLHFEIWTKRHVHKFPDGRISPGEVLGYHFDNMDNRMPLRNVG